MITPDGVYREVVSTSPPPTNDTSTATVPEILGENHG